MDIEFKMAPLGKIGAHQHNNHLSSAKKSRWFGWMQPCLRIAGGALLIWVLAGCASQTTASNKSLSAQQERGRDIFFTHCAVCHDAFSTAPRQGPGLKGLFQKKYLPSGAPANDDRVGETIKLGRHNMPPFQYVFDDQQMNDLLAYLHKL